MMNKLSSAASNELDAIMQDANASGYFVCKGKLHLKFGRATALSERELSSELLESDEVYSFTSFILPNEKQRLVSFVDTITHSGSPLVLINSANNDAVSNFVGGLLKELGHSVDFIRDTDFCKFSFSNTNSDYLIVTTHAKSLQDFSTSILFTDQRLVDVFCQQLNSAYFYARLPSLCRFCSKEAVVEGDKKSQPRKGFSYSGDTSKQNSSIGCEHCSDGYDGVVIVDELTSGANDKYLDAISTTLETKQGPSYKRLVNKIATDNLKTIYSDASAAVLQGRVSLEDVFKTLL